MSNSNLMPNTPFAYQETRIFVRHSDGSSLVVPEQRNDIEQLSFKIHVPFESWAKDRLEAIDETIKSDEEQDLGFFAIQRYLGGASFIEPTERGIDESFAYGYLGQIHIAKPLGEGTGRQILPFDEARDIMNYSPSIDSIDRRLAFQAFQTVEISSQFV